MQLFFSVLFAVSLYCLFSVSSGVNDVAPRSMGMVCRLLVISSFMMLRRFSVMAGGVCMMF
jgi:hypothetical protein